jgi:NAD(P)-dependent dehydrogenase (short-subunit alcohol dehydrogenase family)
VSGNERSPEPTDGRLALVCGGDRADGLRIVRKLAARGMRVVSASRSVQRARRSIDVLGDLADRVAVRELDYADPGSVARLVSWMADRLGRCDVLVNTAVPLRTAHPGAVPYATASQVDTDLADLWRLTLATLPLMRANRYGRVVNVVAEVAGGPRSARTPLTSAVAASGLATLTRELAAEVADDGILVNAYWPVPARPEPAAPWLHPVPPADVVVWLATLPDDGPTGIVHRGRIGPAHRFPG